MPLSISNQSLTVTLRRWPKWRRRTAFGTTDGGGWHTLLLIDSCGRQFSGFLFGVLYDPQFSSIASLDVLHEKWQKVEPILLASSFLL